MLIRLAEKYAAGICSLSVVLVWQPNSEPDLAGYKVYLGSRPGFYHRVIDVGRQTHFQLEEVTDGEQFLTVTAYDRLGNESAFSEEVRYGNAGDGEDAANAGEATLQYVYNFPNPFRAGDEVTTLRYFLEQPQPVTIKIYDVAGEYVRTIIEDGMRASGEQLNDRWDGENDQGIRVSPGLYYAKISTQRENAVIRMAIIP